jgi:hypothetical protein
VLGQHFADLVARFHRPREIDVHLLVEKMIMVGHGVVSLLFGDFDRTLRPIRGHWE